jgi:hypothetical protein
VHLPEARAPETHAFEAQLPEMQNPQTPSLEAHPVEVQTSESPLPVVPASTITKIIPKKSHRSFRADPNVVQLQIFPDYPMLEPSRNVSQPAPKNKHNEPEFKIALNETSTNHPNFKISPQVHADDWATLVAFRQKSRDLKVEGLMLKRADSFYGTGRRKGDWWKWKIDPYSVDAVLIAAQRGHGKRASLYTDYTFAVWDKQELVPVAKAYSGLDDSEINRVDAFIRKNTIDKFGPVRTVKPELVFEIAFEGIQSSPRHKSGIAVRFPRIARWRTDKAPAQADTLQSMASLIGTGEL